MSKGILAALIGVASLFAFNTAQAFNDYGYYGGQTRMAVDVGFTGGGDALATVVYNNGNTQTIYAGDGLLADFGIQHNFAYSDWSLKATVGIDYWSVGSYGTDISFTRYPVDVLMLYNMGRSHIGFGLTEHLSPELDMDGNGPNVNFDNATGVILQYQYAAFTIRATGIHYQVSGGCTSACRVNGGNLGFFFSYAF